MAQEKGITEEDFKKTLIRDEKALEDIKMNLNYKKAVDILVGSAKIIEEEDVQAGETEAEQETQQVSGDQQKKDIKTEKEVGKDPQATDEADEKTPIAEEKSEK